MLKRISTSILLGILFVSVVAFAGSFIPIPISPDASSYNLSDIYTKLTSDTYSYSSHSFSPISTPSNTQFTLTQIWNAIPPYKTLSAHSLDTGVLKAGIYTATTSLLDIEPNLIPSNIATGTNIFGVIGTRVVYTVTYDGNGNAPSGTYGSNDYISGGTVPIDPNTYITGATVTVLDNTGDLYKSGYTFSGWNTQADGLGTDQAASSTFAMGSENVVLYAKWVVSGGCDATCLALRSGLVGYYPLDSDANDYIGTNHGSVSGATPIAGLVSGGYSFNGSSNIIYIPDSNFPMGNSSRTISMWVKTGKPTYEYVGGYGNNVTDNQVQFFVDTVFGILTYTNAVMTSTNVKDNVWHNIIYTHGSDNSNVIYIDGVSAANQSKALTTSSRASGPYTGKFVLGVSWNQDAFYSGIIDEVAVWNRTITQTEAQQLYNNGTGRSLIGN